MVLKETVFDYEINLNLRSKVTILCGDTATGKSFLYDLLNRIKSRDDILCINYDIMRKRNMCGIVINALKNTKNSIVVIDRINMELPYIINRDGGNNTFIIIGRSPKVTYTVSDLAKVVVKDNKIELEYMFPESLRKIY